MYEMCDDVSTIAAIILFLLFYMPYLVLGDTTAISVGEIHAQTDRDYFMYLLCVPHRLRC